MSTKAHEKEDAYFSKMEHERLKKIEEEKAASLAQKEKEDLKELHYMRCPKCGMQLIEIEHKGVKIDECSSCSGVWLDAGELAQVIQLEKGALDKLFSIFQKP